MGDGKNIKQQIIALGYADGVGERENSLKSSTMPGPEHRENQPDHRTWLCRWSRREGEFSEILNNART
ncbi:unnamed protein product [Ilex paraguariensis]|uniref:Uncharacterized protein n=1 Tax=Ilex paraguariensis TaxID=185542 RepID=A0ABC8URW6_9AQUA